MVIRKWEVPKGKFVTPAHILSVHHNEGKPEKLGKSIAVTNQSEVVNTKEKMFSRDIEYDNTIRPSVVEVEWKIKEGTQEISHTKTIICPSLKECGITVV